MAALLDLPHVVYVGLYGFEEETPELLTAVVPLVETAARVPDAWIEDKGLDRGPLPAGARHRRREPR